MSSIYATKYAVDKNIMLSIGSTIAQLRRNVETNLGVSPHTYGQEPGEPHLGGMVQGKADVPQFSTQQSDVLLKAHKSWAHGVRICSPSLQREISHHSVGFADDMDGQVAEDTTDAICIPCLISKLQRSGQTWRTLSSLVETSLRYTNAPGNS